MWKAVGGTSKHPRKFPAHTFPAGHAHQHHKPETTQPQQQMVRGKPSTAKVIGEHLSDVIINLLYIAHSSLNCKKLELEDAKHQHGSSCFHDYQIYQAQSGTPLEPCVPFWAAWLSCDKFEATNLRWQVQDQACTSSTIPQGEDHCAMFAWPRSPQERNSKQCGMTCAASARLWWCWRANLGSGHTPFEARIHFTPCQLSTSIFAHLLTSLLPSKPSVIKDILESS